MPTVYDVVAKHRAALAALDQAAATRLIQRYGRVWNTVQADLNALAFRIQAARGAGQEVSPAWLYQERRLLNIRRAVEGEIRQFARAASLTVRETQRDAVNAALRDAGEVLDQSPAVVGGFERVNVADVGARVMGALERDSPLRGSLAALGRDGGERLERALVYGVSTGKSPREIVRLARHGLGGNLARALTIARTETLRAYRESSREVYESNPEIVKGWSWYAALDNRTCVMCWTMHGKRFPVDEIMATHANCRCTMVPWTKTWAELGVKAPRESTFTPRSGTSEFAKLPADRQRQILGPGRFKAFQSGQLRLEDMVQRYEHPKWGPVRRIRPLQR